MYFYTVTIMKLTSRIYLPPGNRVTRLLGSALWRLRFRGSVFSSGCLQAVTPCLGLVVTALMKKQSEQPIMRFICPLGFSNMAVSQAQRYRFGCGVLWAPWPSEVTRPSVPGSGVSSVWSPWKLQSCAGGRSVRVSQKQSEGSLIGDLQPEFHRRKPRLITWPAKPFIWSAAVPTCHPCNLLLKIPACFLAGRTSCQRALVSQGAETLGEPCCHSELSP